MCRHKNQGGRRCRWHTAPTAIAITNAHRRAAYHEGRCDALAGQPGEDRALDNYMRALEELRIAEYVHADQVIDPDTSRAHEFSRDSVASRPTEWLLQQHQALAHDPDAQEEIAERLVEREADGEELPRQGRYAVRRAVDRIVEEMTARGTYRSEAEAREAVAGWFGQKPDKNMSEAQRAGMTEKQARAEYEDQIAYEFERAHEETRGSLLSKRGRAAGVSTETLFRGPLSQVEPYASEELRSYWARHGRLTWSAFRFELLGRDSDRAAHTRAKTQLPTDVAMVS